MVSATIVSAERADGASWPSGLAEGKEKLCRLGEQITQAQQYSEEQNLQNVEKKGCGVLASGGTVLLHALRCVWNGAWMPNAYQKVYLALKCEGPPAA